MEGGWGFRLNIPHLVFFGQVVGVVTVGVTILYKVKEVGLIPMGGVQITQLVAPLKLHLSVFL